MSDTVHPMKYLGIRLASIPASYTVGIAFVALILLNVAITPNFLSIQTIAVNLTQVCTIAIVAVGMTYVIASGGIDLSVGSTMAIAGALAPLIFSGKLFGITDPVLGVAVAILFPLLVGAMLGLFNGFLITHYGIQPIVATLVLFVTGRGIAQVFTNGSLQVFKRPDFQFIALEKVWGIPVQVLIMFIVVAAGAFALRRMLFGRNLLAVGGNAAAARMAGVAVKRVKLIAYAICGVLAALAGLIVVARNGASDANLVGLGMELDVIAAAAIGGTLLAGGRATILGTFLGACVIQLVRYTLLANGVPDSAALVCKAVIIIFAVWIQRNHEY